MQRFQVRLLQIRIELGGDRMLLLKKIRYNFFIVPLLFYFSTHTSNIGLLIVATGKYIEFVEPLIQSADKHFLTNHKVTYFVFTDGQAPISDKVVSIPQKRLGWPYDSMMRFMIYFENREALKEMDYLFACDADMLFVDTVGDEILGNRVATLHPGYVGSLGEYERRSVSTAYIPHGQGKCYFAGGFNGGERDEFLKMAQQITSNILQDQKNGIIARWHDESHLNRYLLDNEPTVILSPAYCYPQGWKLNYPQKLWALVKDHAKYRT